MAIHRNYIVFYKYNVLLIYILYVSFPECSEEIKSPPSKKIYKDMKSYHIAYDNAENRYV